MPLYTHLTGSTSESVAVVFNTLSVGADTSGRAGLGAGRLITAAVAADLSCGTGDYVTGVVVAFACGVVAELACKTVYLGAVILDARAIHTHFIALTGFPAAWVGLALSISTKLTCGASDCGTTLYTLTVATELTCCTGFTGAWVLYTL